MQKAYFEVIRQIGSVKESLIYEGMEDGEMQFVYAEISEVKSRIKSDSFVTIEKVGEEGYGGDTLTIYKLPVQ